MSIMGEHRRFARTVRGRNGQTISFVDIANAAVALHRSLDSGPVRERRREFAELIAADPTVAGMAVDELVGRGELSVVGAQSHMQGGSFTYSAGFVCPDGSRVPDVGGAGWEERDAQDGAAVEVLGMYTKAKPGLIEPRVPQAPPRSNGYERTTSEAIAESRGGIDSRDRVRRRFERVALPAPQFEVDEGASRAAGDGRYVMRLTFEVANGKRGFVRGRPNADFAGAQKSAATTLLELLGDRNPDAQLIADSRRAAHGGPKVSPAKAPRFMAEGDGAELSTPFTL
jgi:hypothetical protein